MERISCILAYRIKAGCNLFNKMKGQKFYHIYYEEIIQLLRSGEFKSPRRLWKKMINQNDIGSGGKARSLLKLKTIMKN